MSFILAFDVGTTAVKAVLVERETGKMQSAKADCRLIQPNPGWAEQDAEEMWQAVCLAAKRCISQNKGAAEQVDGIALSAPWRHAILLDENGKPLRNSVIWMDGRAGKQAAQLNERMGRYVDHAQGYWPRLMWLKENEPVLWNKAQYILGINDYFKFRATGTISTECSDDQIRSPNKKLQVLYDQILHAAGLEEDLDKFPVSKKCTDCVGQLTQEAAEAMGLQPGIPVFGGFGDLPAVYLGSGCLEKGTAHIYLGTSSWFGELLPDQIEGYSRAYFTADENYQGALFGLTTGGRAYDWILHQFYEQEQKTMGDAVFAKVDADMAEVTPGCNGLIVTHWLNGEPPPLAKNAKALFFNVTEQHDRRHFVRAMLESICYSHRRSLEKYVALHGEPPKRLYVVGGGAISKVWMQMLADILKVPVYVPENPRYVGTKGVYYCVLIGLGIEKDFSALSNESNCRCYLPTKENEAVYDEMYGAYQSLYPALKDVYDRVNGQF